MNSCRLDFLNNTNPFVIFDIDRRHYDISGKKEIRFTHKKKNLKCFLTNFYCLAVYFFFFPHMGFFSLIKTLFSC